MGAGTGSRGAPVCFGRDGLLGMLVEVYHSEFQFRNLLLSADRPPLPPSPPSPLPLPPPRAPAANFIMPVFVHDGEKNIPIDSMPGVARLGWQHGLIDAVAEARSVGVNQVCWGGLPLQSRLRLLAAVGVHNALVGVCCLWGCLCRNTCCFRFLCRCQAHLHCCRND